MNPKELEKLLNELLSGIQEVMQSGEVISDELQGLLADEINNLTQQIDAAYAQNADQSPVDTAEGPIETPVSADQSLLWILSGGDTNAFVNYLRTFPDQNFQSLINNPGLLNAVISQLQQTLPQGAPQIPADGIPDTQLQSSNVQGMKYNPKTQKLMVKFHGGSVYQYDDVPKNIFSLLEHGNAFAKTKGQNQYGKWWPMKNPSLGAAVNQYLKGGGYNYQKLR